MHSDVAIIIPSRLGSVRLKNKALEMIGDKTMIKRVVNQMQKTVASNIYVATDSEKIAKEAEDNGVIPIMTDPDLPSGTDRVYDAFMQLPNRDQIKYVINVQGDMPFIEESVVNEVINELKRSNAEIVTPVAKVSIELARSESNVKAVVGKNGKALYFSRSLIPHGGEEFLYHIGVYGFRADALQEFVGLPRSDLEKTENLEQLRALQNGLDLKICFVTDVPISVDTREDLEKAIAFCNTMAKNYV